MKKIPGIAIVGRTNVGKSSLFNAICGRRLAVVNEMPGVTRDRNYQFVNRYDIPFKLIDTGGLSGEDRSGLHDSIRAQALIAIDEADLIIAVFDGISGLHPYDREVVDILRQKRKPVLWVVNKCEKEASRTAAAEFYSLGIDSYICVSAAHNIGIRELVVKLKEFLAEKVAEGATELPVADDIKVAILGKPNTGKSTLLNRLVGQERLVASDQPGTTVDSIDVQIKREGHSLLLVDTAGLRRKARVKDGSVERYGNLRTLRSLARADVVLLLLDGSRLDITQQDIKILDLAHSRGKGIVIVVNKWDLVEKDHRTAKEFKERIYERISFARYAPIVFVSALTGRRCPQIYKKIIEVSSERSKRIPTAELNRIIQRAFEKNPPPLYRGREIKLFFATQVAVAPPTIILFVNYPAKIGDAYMRYLKKTVRKSFPFEGCDIKFFVRKRTAKEERIESGRVV